MTISIIVSVLAGMAIGLRFKVLLILPAILLAGLLTTALSAMNGDLSWRTISAVVFSALSVQLGYLCGTFAVSMKEAPVRTDETKVLSTGRLKESSSGY
jgi:hypothetical protein